MQINTSITNFLDTRVPHTVLWTADKFVTIAKECGYDGVEWHPIPAPSGTQMKFGLVSDEVKNAISSVHQSTPNQPTFMAAWNNPKRFIAVLYYIFLPGTKTSLNFLEHIQKVVGRSLPMVLYPPLTGGESGTDRDFGEKLFQPTPEVMHAWKVKTARQLIKQSLSKGYTGFCLDTFHMRAKPFRGISLNPWQNNLKTLLEFTKEIHISAGRTDFYQTKIDSQQELGDLIKGKGNSDITKILEAIKKYNWEGPVVIETPAEGLFLLDKSLRPSVDLLVNYHKKIINTVRSILL